MGVMIVFTALTLDVLFKDASHPPKTVIPLGHPSTPQTPFISDDFAEQRTTRSGKQQVEV
jgi:hypothetical protein